MSLVASEVNAMSVREVSWQIEQATVYLPKSGGQGVLIPGNMILTAAHCVPCSSAGGMYQGRSRRYDVEVHGVYERCWATPCFVDPVSDIAVLAAPRPRKRVPGGGFDPRVDQFSR